ncbi:LuxR C-terminal-related transcriptional regulator [Blastococcus sp. SYSU D00820]
MNSDICAMGTMLAAGPAGDLRSEIAAGTRRGAGPVAVQGPGGTGKTLLLGELATAYSRAGLPVLELAEAAAAPATAEFAVLVDDAHRLSADDAGRVHALLDHPGARVALAYRPWPRPTAVTRLVEGMGNRRRSVVLGHVDRALVRSWAAQRLGDAATPALVDEVYTQSGGLPALVHPLLASARRREAGSRLTVPTEVLERLSAELAACSDDTRALLHAVAAGAPLDDEVLDELLEVPAGHAADLVGQARSTGLLLGSGAVVPLVQRVLLAATPADLTRRVRRRLLGLLLERGEEPVDLARTLAAEHVRDPRAAALLERHGDAALAADPALAAELLGAAASTGAPVACLSARRAQAAALAGDLDGALQWADAALADERTPDRGRAAGVTAAVLAQRGLLGRAADLYRVAGRERAGSAALALLATGSPQEAEAVLDEARQAPARGASTMLAVSEELMAQGVRQSLHTGPHAPADVTAALSTLTRAAAVLEPVGRTALLPDTPSAVAALVALHCGELGVAESVLQRAVAADLGGVPCRPRHLLLLAWIAMLAGRMGRAREYMAEAQQALDHGLEPRDELFLRALEVGIARRQSDTPELLRVWGPAREAVVRYPVDLFTLLPLGELVVAAARLEDGDRLAPHVAEAQALLARLGEPQLWATPLHWNAAQAAILTDDPAALRPHAAALVAASRTSPYAAVLAGAGRVWLRVLSGSVDPDDVVASAEQLTEVGLAWDGSRLAGQAAMRTADPRARATLLACARALAGDAGGTAEPEPPARGTAAPARGTAAPAERATAPAGQLSEREREVARLVVAGQTYREIGTTLFISAKTVEHHVSRMRQRLGAGTRSDLLARLRAELAQGA